MTEQEMQHLRRRIQQRQYKLIHGLRNGIAELLPYLDDVESLQTIYAHTLAAFYDDGRPAEEYLKELQGNGLRVIHGTE